MKRFSILTTLFVFLLAVSTTFAAIPQLIPYQANVIGAENKPLDGVYSVTFELFDSPNGGTPMWTVNRSVSIENGYINVMLGEVNPLTGVDFTKQLYLQVTIGNGTPYPRTKLGATPYAIQAIAADKSQVAVRALSVDPKSINWTHFEDAALVAGGDLMGNYPNPTLRDGVVLENIKPGSITQKYLAPNVTVPPSGKAGGDLSGQYPDPIIAKGAVKTDRIADGAVTLEKMANNSVDSDNIINNTIMLADLNDEVKNLGGDLDGTLPNPTVVGFQGVPVSSYMPWDGAVYMFDADMGHWMPMNAAGDVAGPYNNLQLQPGVVTTLEILDGTIVDADVAKDAAIAGTKINPDFGFQNIITTGDLYADNGYFNFDVYGDDFFGNSFNAPNANFDNLTVNNSTLLEGEVEINASINFNGFLDGYNNLVLDDEPITSGDLTGFYPFPLIRDLAVTTNKLADGSVTGAKIADGTITDTDVAGNAAIKGSKILPDFGNQTIKTTGSFDVGGNITNSGGVNVTVDDNLIVTGDLKVNGTINLANVNAVNVTATNGVFQNLTVTNPIVGSMSKSLTDGQGIATFTYNGGASAVVNVNVDAATIGINGSDALYLMDNAVTNAKIADNAVTLNEMADNSVGPNELIATPVVAGDYGTETAVAQFSVDADGRLTFAQNVNVSVNDNPVTSDIDITGTVSNALNLQVRPNTIGASEIIDGSISTLDLNSTGQPKSRQLTSDGSGGVYWGDAMALPYEGSLGTGEDAFKLNQTNTTAGSAAIFNSTIASNMDNAVEITKDVSAGAGSALYVYGIGVMGQNYIAKFENQNLNEGRTAYFQSKSPAGLTGVNPGFDMLFNTADDFVNLDPTDVIEATTVIKNIGVNQSNQQLALKTYGSIQANSAIIGSNLVGTKMLTLGVGGTNGYGEILAPVAVSGQHGTPQMYVNPGMYIDGSVDITGRTHGVGAADFDATMNVDGNTTLNADVYLGNANTDNVYFVADVNSNILPNSNYAFDLGAPGQAWDDVYMQDLFAVNGYFTGNLDVDGNTRLGDALGDAIILNGTISSNMGPVYINDQLNVTGAADFDNTLNVDGAATFNHAITQTNAAQLITFAGNVNANLGVDVAGANLTVASNWDAIVGTAGAFGNASAVSDVYVQGNLESDGNQYFGDALTDMAMFAGIINQTGNAQVTFTGNVDANNGVDVNGANLNVFTNAAIGNGVPTLPLNGEDLYVEGTIEADGQARFDGNVDANLGLDVTGANFTVASNWDAIIGTGGTINFPSAASDAYVQGNLEVDGAAYVASLFVDSYTTGSVLFIGASSQVLEDNGQFFWDNASNFFGLGTNTPSARLDVVGATELNGTLTQTGAANQVQFAGNVDANNGVDVNGANLTVASNFDAIVGTAGAFGNASGVSDVYVQGNLEVDGNQYFGDAVTDMAMFAGIINQTGNAQVTFTGNVDANNGVDVAGLNLTLNGVNIEMNENDIIEVDQIDGGASLFINNINNGTITTGTGQITLNGNVDATNGVDVTGANLTVGVNELVVNWTNGNIQDINSAVTIQDQLNVNFDTDLDANLNVDGATTLNGNVDLGNAAADMISILGLVDTPILPTPDNTQDLGSALNRWNDIFYGGTLTGGDGHFQNLRVDINTDLRGPIFNTTQNSSLTPLQFGDDLMPTLNNTFDIGATGNRWRNINSDALNTWGPGGITVNNAGGITIVGSGALSVTSGGANITGGLTVTGELTANNNINAKTNIYNTGGDVTVNDNLQVNGNFTQTTQGKFVYSTQTCINVGQLQLATAAVVDYTPGGSIEANTGIFPFLPQAFPAGTNGQVMYIVNSNAVFGLTVNQLAGTSSTWTINPGDMAAFIYVGSAWRLLQ